MARTWCPLRSELFLGLKSRFLAKKFDICHTTPILVNGLFLALGDTVHFPPWGQFFDFSIPSYGWRVKKSSPSPLWGHCLSVSALALSAHRLDNLLNRIVSWNEWMYHILNGYFQFLIKAPFFGPIWMPFGQVWGILQIWPVSMNPWILNWIIFWIESP